MDYDKTAKFLVTAQGVLDTARERYADHMAAVRRGTDAGLRAAHLAAAQREYDTVVMMRDQIARTFDTVREV